MNWTLRLIGAALIACTLVSCATANNAVGMVGRMVRSITRTAGLSAQATEPGNIDSGSGDPSAVEARGRLIETQGVYGVAPEVVRPEKMAFTH